MQGGIYVDGTTGGGGHSIEIAKRLNETGRLICIDQDEEALFHAEKRLSDYEGKITYVHDNFSNIKNILERIGINKINGLILDLGVSSYQLDNKNRGFSYMQNAPLDMRMDASGDLTAYEVVNTYDREDLKRIIKDYGEENWAARIAEFIENERKIKDIETTGELVEIIKKAIPARARRDGPHPAKRTFQAIRIEVNNELGIIEKTITDSVACMEEKGRICIITFHSLEDRIVKNTYKYLQKDCICPPELPVCKCDKRQDVKIVTRKPIVPSELEVENNPRSRSAKLRIAERV
jgi:16S rRNA (cytosine1402-N4)-methyltransferase